MKFSAELLDLLDTATDGSARATLQTYFTPEPDGTFSGAHFERIGGGGDRPQTAHTITADDLVALTTLSVDVPGATAVRILGSRSNEIGDLLGKIPTTLDLVDAQPSDIGPDSPVWQLYELLRSMRGLGRTKVSKLLARKRPRLIPIYDSVIGRELSIRRGAHWEPLAAALNADSQRLHKQLIAIRDDAGIGDDISPLRTLDVLVWMTGKGYLRPDPDAVTSLTSPRAATAT